MKTLLRIAKEAVRYKGWLLLSIFGTLMMTTVNLIAPRIMAGMTGLVAAGMTRENLNTVLWMAGRPVGPVPDAHSFPVFVQLLLAQGGVAACA